MVAVERDHERRSRRGGTEHRDVVVVAPEVAGTVSGGDVAAGGRRGQVIVGMPDPGVLLVTLIRERRLNQRKPGFRRGEVHRLVRNARPRLEEWPGNWTTAASRLCR